MSKQDTMYTDQELLWATQIAYCNVMDKDIMAKEAKQFIADVAAGKICQGWKLVSIGDDQKKSGMFALTIETGENEAIVAFRGSESVNMDQFIKD